MEKTIAAISTAYGESGIGIVRMSGPLAFEIGKRIFDNVKGEIVPRHMYFGHIVDPKDGKTLDEVLCVFMKAPHTYTAEDLVEIQCHGSMLALKSILSLCLREGAEMAEPGEFSKRAFMNGRLDLTKAEAVIDLIKAKSYRSFDTALGQLKGNLFEKVSEIRKDILELLVSLSVNMDYPDEDIEVLTYEKMGKSLSSISDALSNLLTRSAEGKILREGLRVAIIGKPNVGKSSLLNRFLNEDRSIVTDIPGTTRDTIEEQAVIRGIPICFTDTAGIRDSADPVEALGIERSKDAFNRADLILLLLDASRELSEEDKTLISMAEGRPVIVVLNKTDLGEKIDPPSGLTVVKTSMTKEEGLKELADAIENFVFGGKVSRENDVVVSNVRHIELLRKASAEIEEAINAVGSMTAMDFIEVNVKAAFDYLGEIIGETAGEEVIDEVFSRFCLGK